jgi:beta-alanine degradation protein BauB
MEEIDMRPANDSARVTVKVPLLALGLIFVAGTLWAQDPVKVAPKHFKVLLENEHVRVLDFHSKAGEKIPMHSHPAYISYSVSGSGKTKFTSADGKTTERPANTGQAVWHDAETHASEYAGASEAHVILVELKPKP